MRFRDRTDAGRRLGDQLRDLEVASILDAPLEVFVARRVVPTGHPERGIGAIAEGSVRGDLAASCLAVPACAPDTA